MRAAADALGGLDILVHNAGVFEPTPLGGSDADAAAQAYQRQFALNVEGVFTGTAVCDGTKAAVAGLARGWVRDLAGRTILVNVIQPGPIATELNPADSDFARQLTPLAPLGRYGRVEEVAAVAAFLASDEASFITGTTINVDGGFLA